jgi:glycosyltransferase involved in cell wall biosynthesis
VVYSSFTDDFVPANIATIRGMLNFSGSLIVSVGRLVPWKGFSALIEIVPELAKNFPDLKLLIVGDGPEMAVLEEKIDELSVRDNVALTGRVEHAVLLRYIQIADVFVLNTGYEGFSHQILEVMNVGVPVVTTHSGGNPELVEDKKNGLLVTFDDRDELRVAIINVLKDTKLAGRLVAEGKKTVLSYTDTRMLDALVPLFQRT